MVVHGRREVCWPVRVGVVPLTPGYQPRPVQQQVWEQLASGGTAVLTQVLAGLGGIGKTQLAAALAEQAWTAGVLDLLMWVTAASRAAVLTGYAAG